MAFSQSDYAFGKWDKSLTSMPSPRAVFSTLVYHDSIYVLGGFKNINNLVYVSSVDVYVPASDAWITGITEFPFPRGCPNACLIGDKIYAFGGSHPSDGGENYTAYDSLHIYDIKSKTWTRGESLPVALSYFGADTLNGKIYVAGGGGTNWTITNALYVYDPELDEWTEKATMNRTRWGLSAKSRNGKLYVFGGYSGSNWKISKSLEVYDPETDEWIDLSDANIKRTSMSMFSYKEQLFVMGGYSESTSNQTQIISRYDFATDSWFDFFNEGDDLPEGRRFTGSCVYDEKFYLLGGGASEIMDNNWSYSLKKIQQGQVFLDTTLGSESVELDLSEIFYATDDESVSYNICEGYDESIVSATIEGSTLKLEESTEESGSTELIINALTATDTISSNPFIVAMLGASLIKTDVITHFAIYPNPASEEVSFSFSTKEAGVVSIEIFNSLGQEIEHFSLNATSIGLNCYNWNVEDYSNGLYMIVLNTGTSKSVRTLLINH